MKSKVFLTVFAPILITLLLYACAALTSREAPSARMLDPIVSTDWLAANSYVENLVIIDIRGPGDYAAGHIPGSINEPFVTAFDPCSGPSSNWVIGTKDCIWLELPATDDLMSTIGKLGITPDSRVVIVTAPNPKEPPFYGLANATRVADTLIYAGVANVAILDGGYSRWVSEGRATTKQVPAHKSVTYRAEVNKAMFISTDYVHMHMRDAVIVDARDANVYSGLAIEPFTDKAGHIPNAKSLPAPWIWNQNPDGTYTYKDSKTLGKMASGVISKSADPRSREIFVYCGVGGYASSWWFVLTQVLGYQNVKIYDGAAQEWARSYDMVIQ